MAITLQNTPPLIIPVYSPFYFVCTSNNVTQSNFRYVFDVFTGTTTAAPYVFRSRTIPRPVSNNAIFNADRVLESYLSYNNTTWNNFGITNGRTVADRSYMSYMVSIGEEYVYYWPFDDNFFPSAYPSTPLSAYNGYIGFTSFTTSNYFSAGDVVTVSQLASGNTNTQYNGNHTVLYADSTTVIIDVPAGVATPPEAGTIVIADLSTTTITGLTISGPKYAFNGVLQYPDLPSWNYAPYIMTSTTGSFLTHQPRSGVYIRDNQHACLAYLNTGMTGTRMLVTSYHTSGGSLQASLIFTNTPNLNNLIHVGTGINNINNYGSGVVVDADTDYKYTVVLLDNLASPCSETITYLVDSRCSKYENIRFMFLNRLGGWDFFNAYLVSRKTVDINTNTYQKILDYNYAVRDRGNTVYNSTVQSSYVVTTDWLNQDESNWLEELWTSPEVYWLKDDGVYSATTGVQQIPVVLTVKNQEIRKIVNDFIVNYDITFDLANQDNVQRNS